MFTHIRPIGGMDGGILPYSPSFLRKSCPHMALRDAEIRAFRPIDTPYKKADGGALRIEIFLNNSKLCNGKHMALWA